MRIRYEDGGAAYVDINDDVGMEIDDGGDCMGTRVGVNDDAWTALTEVRAHGIASAWGGIDSAHSARSSRRACI